jgi:hypothetical protein
MKPPIDSPFLPRDPQRNPPVHIAEAARLFARLTGKARGDDWHAAEMAVAASLTRAQILEHAASAIMTQANGQPQAIIALLR